MLADKGLIGVDEGVTRAGKGASTTSQGCGLSETLAARANIPGAKTVRTRQDFYCHRIL